MLVEVCAFNKEGERGYQDFKIKIEKYYLCLTLRLGSKPPLPKNIILGNILGYRIVKNNIYETDVWNTRNPIWVEFKDINMRYLLGLLVIGSSKQDRQLRRKVINENLIPTLLMFDLSQYSSTGFDISNDFIIHFNRILPKRNPRKRKNFIRWMRCSIPIHCFPKESLLRRGMSSYIHTQEQAYLSEFLLFLNDLGMDETVKKIIYYGDNQVV